MITLQDISIRDDFNPGDIGFIVLLHGRIYYQEYGFGMQFEAYVAEGMAEFYRQYNPVKERIWIAEHHQRIVGCLVLKNREESAQLRYFLIRPEYRSIGLGKKLMENFMDFLRQCGYRSSYLLTTSELTAAAGLYKKNGFVLEWEKESLSFGKKIIEQKYVLRA